MQGTWKLVSAGTYIDSRTVVNYLTQRANLPIVCDLQGDGYGCLNIGHSSIDVGVFIENGCSKWFIGDSKELSYETFRKGVDSIFKSDRIRFELRQFKGVH